MKINKIILSFTVAFAIMFTSLLPVHAYTKDETVYVKINPDGSEETVIVSEHLQNDKEEDSLKDISDLSDIFNVNGEEAFQQEGEKIVWQSEGHDIYYQGKTQNKLPITMQITYKLDGQTMNVDNMLGKSGDVEITIQFKNNEKVNNLHVPFVVISGTMLPTETVSQVKVTNGKAESNGSSYLVVGLATPGLYEDFEKNQNLKDLDTIKLSYKTTDFKLENIITVVKPAVLSDSDLEVFDKLNSGLSLSDTFSSSYDKIENGSNQLNAGIQEYSTQYNRFNDGVQTLNDQSQLLVEGSNKILTGVSQLDGGLGELEKGLNELSSHSEELRVGTQQLVDQVLATVNTQLKDAEIEVTAENYSTVLSAAISNYQAKLEELESLPQERKEAMGEMYINSVANLKGVITQLGIAKNSLDNIFTFQAGIQTYTGGVDQASQSMKQIKEGSKTLLDGSNDLLKGITKLVKGTDVLASNSTLLNEATQTLMNGSSKLSKGINQFGEEGIDRVTNIIKNDLESNIDKIQQLKKLAENYKTFTKLSNEVNGSTKFIIIMNGKRK